MNNQDLSKTSKGLCSFIDALITSIHLSPNGAKFVYVIYRLFHAIHRESIFLTWMAVNQSHERKTAGLYFSSKIIELPNTSGFLLQEGHHP